MKFHPDVLAAHAEFGGDLETMQKLYEYPDLASRISQQDAELGRLRRELADVRDNLAEAEKDTHYWRVEYDKARKAAE